MDKKEPIDRGGRRNHAHQASVSTRSALLDSAEQVMLEEGYAAVSSRRLAARAGVNSALVHYYFGSMDNLFVALFRRGSERSYQRLLAAAESDQPLWALWAAIHDQSRTSLTMEFVSLATHRPSIRTEITQSSKRFRELQLEIVTRALRNHDDTVWTPITLVMLMSSVSRFLRIEESFDIDSGHAEITTLIENILREVEGPDHAA
ncbi:TetR/AcrR family transcriptional regulator [Nocardia testacea]|uniref:TetR/AcrR family transcriptional regulator n=1 Tax=Nocardia testacea TaxID=248551 RepID=UPI003A869276